MEFPHIHKESEVLVTCWRQQGGEPRSFVVNNCEGTGQLVLDDLQKACRASSHSLKNKEGLTPYFSFATSGYPRSHRWQRKNRTSLFSFEIPILSHNSKNINLCTFHLQISKYFAERR